MSYDDDDEEGLTTLEKLGKEAQREGYKPGSPDFERRKRQMQVIRCRELRGNPLCTECNYFDDCELVKQVLRDNKGLTG